VPDFRNGVFWVDLAPLRDAALVAETIAQTLGAKDGLAEHIGERQMLLVLDNLEQVVESAPELAELVEARPNLRLLDTSRELLRVRGEIEYPVPPLATPEAIELFVARSGLPPTDTIAELCRRLDNLPLAIELAAARASVLSPTQILERLSERLDLFKGGRDAEARQLTLRATIEWSHELLDDTEKTLFASLSVFRGGWTLEAAEQVSHADIDAVQSLVDKSLVRRTDTRFSMLETIREYAAERLDDGDDADEFRRHHALYFLALAEQAEPKLRDYDKETLDRLDLEHSNVMSALDSLEQAGETELAQRLGGAAFWYWRMRGHLSEGRRRLNALLSSDDRVSKPRAKALIGAADLAIHAGDTEMARRLAHEALALQPAVGDPWGTAYSMFIVGMTTADEDKYERAQDLFEKAEGLFREIGDIHMTLFARRMVAWMHFERGDVPGAQALHEDVVREARAAGDTFIQQSSLNALAEYALDDGRFGEAARMLAEVIRIQRELGETVMMPRTLCTLSRALALNGEPRAAARVLSAAITLEEEAGSTFRPYLVKYNDETHALIQRGLDEAAFAEAWAQGQKLTADQAVALALGSEINA
jgi:predicted ATPase